MSLINYIGRRDIRTNAVRGYECGDYQYTVFNEEATVMGRES